MSEVRLLYRPQENAPARVCFLWAKKAWLSLEGSKGISLLSLRNRNPPAAVAETPLSPTNKKLLIGVFYWFRY